jgi:hypothetical protein
MNSDQAFNFSSYPSGGEAGIHYVATGERHLKEAVTSALSARRVMPEIPIALFTDMEDHPLTKNFDYVAKVQTASHSFHDVVEPLLRSPFVKTLHLDTDTYICGDCREVFEALDHFEFAGVHDPYRSDLKVETLPTSMPTINGGVLAYKLTPAVRDLLANWSQIHKEKFAAHTKQNQPSLRETVYKSSARILILPPEYNLRTWHPVSQR